jgi:hypothetical protein
LRSVLAGILLCCALGQPVPASSRTLECSADAHTIVLRPSPDSRVLEARAVWLNESLLRWPGVEASGRFRLYYSTDGKALAEPGSRVTGADGALELEPNKGPVPPEVAEHGGAGVHRQRPARAVAARLGRGDEVRPLRGPVGRALNGPVQAPLVLREGH